MMGLLSLTLDPVGYWEQGIAEFFGEASLPGWWNRQTQRT
jgi:hypothetical protein